MGKHGRIRVAFGSALLLLVGGVALFALGLAQAHPDAGLALAQGGGSQAQGLELPGTPIPTGPGLDWHSEPATFQWEGPPLEGTPVQGAPGVSSRVVILNENFESGFPRTGWTLSGNPTWDDVTCRSVSPSHSIWPAAVGAGSRPCPGPYAPNMNAWAIYGPFDLSNAAYAELDFNFGFIRTEPWVDPFFWGASNDGIIFHGWASGGEWGRWDPELLSLGRFVGDSSVWIGFRLASNGGVEYEGVYIDDVVVWKELPSPPTPTPSPAPTPIVREFPVVTNTATQCCPAISGNLVVWEDGRNDLGDIYGKDLATGREFAVVTNTARQTFPDISGSLVVWEDWRNGNVDIYGKDLASGREFAAVTHPAGQRYPAISGNLVVWTDWRNGNSDIYGKDLATGREFAVDTHTAGQRWPAISGSTVVWEDYRNGNYDIYGRDLASGREFAVVTNTAGQWWPAISGNLVVWKDGRNGSCTGYPSSNCDIYGQDLATGREFAVVTHTAGQYWPAISGNTVVWEDYRNGNYDIYGRDLATGQEFAVVTHTASQQHTAISGNLVVWMDYRNGNNDIYGARLEWPPAPGACSLTGTVRSQSGRYYLEEAGRVVAFLYGNSVNFPAYLGQRVTVGGPCRPWRESAGPRPIFLAQTIQLATPAGGPSGAKLPKGATRGW